MENSPEKGLPQRFKPLCFDKTRAIMKLYQL